MIISLAPIKCSFSEKLHGIFFIVIPFKVMDYWGPSKKLLSDLNFLRDLKEFDKDSLQACDLFNLTKLNVIFKALIYYYVCLNIFLLKWDYC